MQVAARLERIIDTDVYTVKPAGGVAIITTATSRDDEHRTSLDATEVELIRRSVDLAIYYIREDGVYVRSDRHRPV